MHIIYQLADDSTMCLYSTVSGCPVGYYEIDGYVSDTPIDNVSLTNDENCGEHCNKNYKCQAFQIKSTETKCMLLDEPTPNGPKHKDYLLCAKGK